jgi:3-deoxy-alpha-D-manno-octulosonate 8-oxidase
MEEFYPHEVEEFRRMADRQKVDIPKGLCKYLTDAQRKALYDSTIIHEKPLANALGDVFRNILTFDKVVELFERM